LLEKALEYHANKLITIDRWKDETGKIQFFNVNVDRLEAVPPIFYIRSVRLRRDFGNNMPKGRRIKNIAITSSLDENSEIRKLEEKVADFFEIPFFSVGEAIKRNYDAVMQISRTPSNRIKITFQLIPEQVEIGPQIIVSYLVWKLTR
jgi:rRNA maturation protein Rpf1